MESQKNASVTIWPGWERVTGRRHPSGVGVIELGSGITLAYNMNDPAAVAALRSLATAADELADQNALRVVP
jgi:hypothetical protein